MNVLLAKRIRENQTRGLLLGIVLCAGSLVLPFKRITQEKIHSKNDLKFVKGQLSDFLFDVNRSTQYSFRLIGFSKPLHIDPDFRYLFDVKAFTKLNYGDSLTVGLSRNGYEQLRSHGHKRIAVYSISNSTNTFLDPDTVIKNYNSPWPIYFSLLFLIAGCYVLYAVYKVHDEPAQTNPLITVSCERTT